MCASTASSMMVRIACSDLRAFWRGGEFCWLVRECLCWPGARIDALHLVLNVNMIV
jgi:hypothetical protein